MTRTDAELEAIIMARTADILCQQLSVVDGVCRVEIYDPPGADDENWAVSLTASPERVEGEFYSKGGARGTVVSNPVDATADETVDAINAKLGWKLTTRKDR